MNLQTLHRLVPVRVRDLAMRVLPVADIRLKQWRRDNPHLNVKGSDENRVNSPYRFGILTEPAQYHQHYVAAALEMGVPFRVIDLMAENWQEQVRESGCDVFLAWPNANLSVWREMIDDRLRIIAHDMGLPLYPSLNEIWVYENKRRLAYWLMAHDLPHPRTWVFYDRREALRFARTSPLPIVIKSNIGASAKGVTIVRDRKTLVREVKKAMGRGRLAYRQDVRDREWGTILLQEYLPDVIEWRMVRLGDHYYGYKKERVGDFHSGSGAWSWGAPPREALDLLRHVTERFGITSVAIDTFITTDGRHLVNELQTVFAAKTPVDQLVIDGVAGRYRYDTGSDEYVFEAGEFARHQCCNSRFEYLLTQDLETLRQRSQPYMRVR